MQAFSTLTRRGQLGRLRRLGRAALGRYGLEDARLTPLRHEHNTTFRVDARGGPYVLRISRPDVRDPGSIASEAAWLCALRRDTDLGVPEPVAADDGSLVVVAADPGLPEPRACILLRWLDGRFVDRGLTPAHLRRVGALTARLHEHSMDWAPPREFRRPRVDTLTSAARNAAVSSSVTVARRGVHPTEADGEEALALVEELVSASAAPVLSHALEIARATTRSLGDADAFGLLHADLHYENVLFHGGEARAIDFDDCGWGFHLYDLAITLIEIEERPRYEELRDAFIGSYAQERPLPAHHTHHLEALFVLRRMQMLMWIIESREHPAFRDRWQAWAREDLAALAQAVAARG